MKKILLLFSITLALCNKMVTAQTTPINGLVALVSFKDYPQIATKAQIEALHNQTSGFNLFGNTTSVREYFRVQTNNKIDLTVTVVEVQLPDSSSKYLGVKEYDGPQLLVQHVIDAIRAQYPAGIPGLTLHPNEPRLRHFSIVTQGRQGEAVNFGIATPRTILSNGVELPVTAVTLLSNQLGVSTFAHEYGHLDFNWTDYYRIAFSNLGDYDLMASGGTIQGPMPINPALRLQRGWIDAANVIPVSGTTTQTYTLTANDYTKVHKYTNPNNPKEYLLFNVLKHGGYYYGTLDNGKVMPEGLAIWYVNEDAGLDTPGQYDQYQIKLVQADGLDEMQDDDSPDGGVRSDAYDLYGAYNTSFPNNHPLRWRDGGELGISITNITAPNTTVSFTVNARPNTVIAKSDNFGTISPKGTLSATTGSSKTFTFTPNIGYELNTVKVNGVQVTASNPYTLTNISGTKTIEATFKRQTNVAPLPSPWLKADVGSTGTPGFTAQSNGAFYLESYANNINESYDNFTYVYQNMSGNGTIIARIADYNIPTFNQKVGIMLRASLQPNAIQNMVVKIPHEGIEAQQRSSSGSNLDRTALRSGQKNKYHVYNWMKITRLGNQLYSYVSRDGNNWEPIGQQTINLPSQVLIGLFITGANGTYPSKAVFDNVQVLPLPSACSLGGTKITGTVTGTPGSWNNLGNTRDKVYDGDIFTYFDADSSIATAGLSLTTAVQVTAIKFFPRAGATSRMLNGKFQGSNSANFSSGVVDLATITTEPTYDWNCITVSNASTFKYLRYISPEGGHGNVSEVEFYKGSTTTTSEFCFEAESASSQSSFTPFQVINDNNASGGSYIVVPSGGNQSSPPTNSIALYSFNVPTTATYNFWVRILAPTSNDNSMYIRTDQNTFEQYTPGTNTSWTWKRWGSKSMSAGNHTLSIARYEDGLQIDKILITKSGSTPTGTGCTSSREEEVLEEYTEDVHKSQLLLSPNPSSNVFSITSIGKDISYLSVSNSMGAHVFSTADVPMSTRTDFGADFENGIYTIHIKYDDGTTESQKVVKIR